MECACEYMIVCSTYQGNLSVHPPPTGQSSSLGAGDASRHSESPDHLAQYRVNIGELIRGSWPAGRQRGHTLTAALPLWGSREALVPGPPGSGTHSYHQLLDGGVFFRLPARGGLLVDNLHSDIVFG